MNAEELINVCQAVTHGNQRQVRNLKTKQRGLVVKVGSNVLTVQVGKTKEVWATEDCEEDRSD